MANPKTWCYVSTSISGKFAGAAFVRADSHDEADLRFHALGLCPGGEAHHLVKGPFLEEDIKTVKPEDRERMITQEELLQMTELGFEVVATNDAGEVKKRLPVQIEETFEPFEGVCDSCGCKLRGEGGARSVEMGLKERVSGNKINSIHLCMGCFDQELTERGV